MSLKDQIPLGMSLPHRAPDHPVPVASISEVAQTTTIRLGVNVIPIPFTPHLLTSAKHQQRYHLP